MSNAARAGGGPNTPNVSGGNRGNRVVSIPSVQSRLDDDSFAKYLDGFENVSAQDLLEAHGGRVRYVIEDNATGARQYRLGGWLQKVDPQLRYFRCFNPFVRRSWSVQLAPPGKTVLLWYMPPGTSDEVAMMRRLLQQLESGEITIRKLQ